MTIKSQFLATVLGSTAAAIALGLYISGPAAQASNNSSNPANAAQNQAPAAKPSANGMQPHKSQANAISTHKTTRIAWQPDFATAQRVSQQSDKPIMIVFGASWCGACRTLKKNTLTNARVAEAAEKWVAVEIDVDKEPKIAAQYGITSLPTTVFLKGNSKKFGFVGAAGPEDMLNVMEAAHAKIQGAPASQS